MPIYGLSAALAGVALVAEPDGQPGPAAHPGGRRVRPVLLREHPRRPRAAADTADSQVPVPSVLDGLFLLSYALLGLFLWRLGSRSGGAGRRDILDTLIVVGGVAPVFWLFLVAPLFETGAPLPALLTYVAYPVGVFGLFCLTVRLAFVARRRTVLHLLLGGWIVGELSADLVFLSVGVTRHLCLRAVVAGAVDRLRDLRRLPCPAPASQGSPGAAHAPARQRLPTAVGAGRVPRGAHRHDLLRGADHGSPTSPSCSPPWQRSSWSSCCAFVCPVSWWTTPPSCVTRSGCSASRTISSTSPSTIRSPDSATASSSPRPLTGRWPSPRSTVTGQRPSCSSTSTTSSW